jgi:hypothetical protein
MEENVKILTLTLVIIVFLILGCQPSQSAISTAIAQTQVANPTLTNTPLPTPTPTLTPTFTPSPSPTPDLRVIKAEPKEFLLTAKDLPAEGKYYLPAAGWISPHHNIEIIQDMGAEKGKAYINETGRIDGWWVYYRRGTKRVLLPFEVYDNVIMYQSASGAEIFLNKYEGDNMLSGGFIELESAIKIGENSRTFVKKKDGNINYNITFSYRNYVHRISGYGLEAEVDSEFVENVANLLLKKLIDAPLSSP